MKPEDTFEVLKGTIKTVNIADEIRKLEQEFVDWVTPYYHREDLDYIAARKEVYHDYGFDFIYNQEPIWPKQFGELLRKQYIDRKQQMINLRNIRDYIIMTAFNDADDDEIETDYSIDAIIVRHLKRNQTHGINIK